MSWRGHYPVRAGWPVPHRARRSGGPQTKERFSRRGIDPGGVMFVYVWEYLVVPTNQPEFEREYGPEGAWVALFAQAPGYLGTSLLRDRSRSDRFVTIDRWESEEAHSAFRKAFRAEFEALDARCEELTRSETLLGYFHSREPMQSRSGPVE